MNDRRNKKLRRMVQRTGGAISKMGLAGSEVLRILDRRSAVFLYGKLAQLAVHDQYSVANLKRLQRVNLRLILVDIF